MNPFKKVIYSLIKTLLSKHNTDNARHHIENSGLASSYTRYPGTMPQTQLNLYKIRELFGKYPDQ